MYLEFLDLSLRLVEHGANPGLMQCRAPGGDDDNEMRITLKLQCWLQALHE